MNEKTFRHRYWSISGVTLFFFAIFPVLQGNAEILSLQHGVDVEEYGFSCVTRDALDSIWMTHIVDNSLQKKNCSPLFEFCSETSRTEFLACRGNDMYIPLFSSVEIPKTSSFSDHILFFGIHTFLFLKNEYNTTFVTDTLRIGIENPDFAPSHSKDEDFIFDLLPPFEEWKKPGKFTFLVFIILTSLLLVWMTKE